MQTAIDLEGVIEIGVVDQPLPAHRGARLFEIHAHDNQQVLFEP